MITNCYLQKKLYIHFKCIEFTLNLSNSICKRNSLIQLSAIYRWISVYLTIPKIVYFRYFTKITKLSSKMIFWMGKLGHLKPFRREWMALTWLFPFINMLNMSLIVIITAVHCILDTKLICELMRFHVMRIQCWLLLKFMCNHCA